MGTYNFDVTIVDKIFYILLKDKIYSIV